MWADLNAASLAAASVLGWDEASWTASLEDDDAPNPVVYTREWSTLSAKEQVCNPPAIDHHLYPILCVP